MPMGNRFKGLYSFEGWCIARMTSRRRSPMRHPPPCKRGRHRSIYYIIITPGKQASHGEGYTFFAMRRMKKISSLLRIPIQKYLPQGGARSLLRKQPHAPFRKRNKKAHPMDELFLILVVRSERFELSRITPLPPEDSASASSATTAYKIELRESSRKKSGAAGET